MGAVGLALDLEDDGAVDQAVEESHGQGGIAQILAPGFEVDVGHQRRAGLVAAGVHDLVQQTGGLWRVAAFEAIEAKLVDDEQFKAGIVPDPLAQGPIGQAGAQGRQQLRAGGVADALALGTGSVSNGLDQEALAYSGMSCEDQTLAAADEAPPGQALDLDTPWR